MKATDFAPPKPGEPLLFLGRLDQAGLRHELAEAGVLNVLAARGHPDFLLETGVADEEHRLHILEREGRESLIDLRLSENAILLPLDESDTDSGALSVLTITWLSLQNPGAPFTSERPRLPGQRHPGLGLGRALIARLLTWAGKWGKDGLANLPMYYHNAYLYAALFDFVSPGEQGRFEALRRDLSSLSLAEASSAVAEGLLVEEPGGNAFRWEPGEMVAPLTDRARIHASSDAYRRAVERARDSVRFHLPGRPDSQGGGAGH